MRDSLVVVAFAEIPEADLVEVVQADGAGDGVDQDGVGDGGGDYVGEVDGEEVGGADDGLGGQELVKEKVRGTLWNYFGVDVADHDENEEGEG
jgi:hypothetical protein